MLNTNKKPKKLIGKLKRNNCIVCKFVYYTPIEEAVYHQRQNGVRRRNCITCSPKCSKIYFRNKKKYKH